jgi:hypothetical protein
MKMVVHSSPPLPTQVQDKRIVLLFEIHPSSTQGKNKISPQHAKVTLCSVFGMNGGNKVEYD